jgi:hypothetical protein
MFDWLAEHRAIAMAGLAVACLAVGYVEFRMMRERAVAAATWFFGLLVVCIYVGGSLQLGPYRLVVAIALFVGGLTAIIRLARGGKWRR